MHVGIVGGGYAGRMAAVRLAAAGHQISLIDARTHWVERTRLHQAAATGRSVERPHRALTDRIGAQFVHDRLIALEPGGLALASGARLRCDRVIVAVGSVPDRRVPGVAEHALALGSPEEATAIGHRLAALDDGARIVVVGAGLTGLELATEVAESHPRLSVTLLGDPARDLSEAGAEVVRAALQRLGITQQRARVEAVTPDGLACDVGDLPAELVLWAAGCRAPGWLEHAGLPLDGQGRIRVDPDLRVAGLPHVVAAGDCAAVPYRMACATAMPLGCHAAQTLIRESRGEASAPFRFGFVLRCVSLGRGEALLQLTDPDDAARPRVLHGALARWAKERILDVTVGAPGWEITTGLPLYRWPRGRAEGRALQERAPGRP